jgi:hypothetical protein
VALIAKPRGRRYKDHCHHGAVEKNIGAEDTKIIVIMVEQSTNLDAEDTKIIVIMEE